MAHSDQIPYFPHEEAAAKEEIRNAIYLVTGMHILDQEAEGILQLYKKHIKERGSIPMLVYIKSIYGAANR